MVGENGAGKTTLVKLLARFYDPSEGVILLDGKDLREYDLEDLRHQIGVIFQDFIRYDLTVKENIGLGQIEHVDNMSRIVHASEQGGTSSLIAGLPKGFDTVLGRTFEEGVDLSGGEWQRLALSRAFMRDAPILILDEPTAALDAFAEYEIYGRFCRTYRRENDYFYLSSLLNSSHGKSYSRPAKWRIDRRRLSRWPDARRGPICPNVQYTSRAVQIGLPSKAVQSTGTSYLSYSTQNPHNRGLQIRRHPNERGLP